MSALAVALVGEGDRVKLLFTSRPPNPFEVKWLADRDISWRYWGDGRPTTVRHAAVLRETLRTWKPDAVMFEFGAVSLGLSCSWAYRVPVRIARYLTAMEAMRYDGQRIVRSLILRRRLVYRCATHIAVNARPLQDEVTSIYRVPAARVLLQLQGVHRPSEPLLPLTGRSRDVVCVGRLARTKGQHVLIEALGRLRRRGVDVRVHFVGDGDQQWLCDHAAEHGVADLCVFHGAKSREEVYSFLLHHAIAIQPSLSDALPQSSQEAVVCGAVLVASRVGGLPDIVTEGESGVLVPSGDADALADALHRLARDNRWLAHLSRGAARASVRVAMDRRAPLEAARLHRLVSAGRLAADPRDRDIPE